MDSINNADDLNKTWNRLLSLVNEFERLQLTGALNFEEFNRVAIVHHSTAIEGTTLTLEETTALLLEGITSKGKSMRDHEMVNDHYKALLFVLHAAQNKETINQDFL